MLAFFTHRSLVVAQGKAGVHYGDKVLDICTIFNLSSLPIEAHCINNTMEDCTGKRIDEPLMLSDTAEVKYCGKFVKMGAKSNRDAFIMAASIGLPLQWTDYRLGHIEQFKNLLLADLKENEKYTVVHWRRGDQLTTRCVMARDVSVNCGTAQDLIRKVSQYTSDRIIYIATNEPSSSQEMKALRAAGYKTWDDILVPQELKDTIDTIGIFVIETALMIEADTFVGWGLSEVNDVVEFERMRLNKTFCVAQNYSEIVKAYYKTWCFAINFDKISRDHEKIPGNRVWHPQLFTGYSNLTAKLFDLRGVSDPHILPRVENPATFWALTHPPQGDLDHPNDPSQVFDAFGHKIHHHNISATEERREQEDPSDTKGTVQSAPLDIQGPFPDRQRKRNRKRGSKPQEVPSEDTTKINGIDDQRNRPKEQTDGIVPRDTVQQTREKPKLLGPKPVSSLDRLSRESEQSHRQGQSIVRGGHSEGQSWVGPSQLSISLDQLSDLLTILVVILFAIGCGSLAILLLTNLRAMLFWGARLFGCHTKDYSFRSSKSGVKRV